MRCFVVGSSGDASSALAAEGVLDSLGYAHVRAADLVELKQRPDFAADPQPILIVVSDDLIAEAVALARREDGRVFVICATRTIAPILYKELVRMRAGEWVAHDRLAAELPEIVSGRSSAPHRRGAVKIVSFASSKGGVGNTTLAVEVAIHLASGRQRSGQRVALLDLNLQGGTLAELLDVEPLLDIDEIAGRPERLDEQLVDVFTSRHASGIHVFASRERDERPDGLDPQIVFSFLDALSARYDRILIDLPVERLAWTDNLLHGSDVVVVSGGGEVPALRRLSARLAAMDRLGIGGGRLCAVVGHCGADVFGRVRHRTEIEAALAGRKVFFVRRDWEGVATAANAGSPLIDSAPNSRALRDMRRVAEWVGQAVQAPDPAAQPALGGGA